MSELASKVVATTRSICVGYLNQAEHETLGGWEEMNLICSSNWSEAFRLTDSIPSGMLRSKEPVRHALPRRAAVVRRSMHGSGCARASTGSKIPKTYGDLVLVYPSCVVSVIIGSFAQNLELPEEEHSIRRSEHQFPIVFYESGERVLLSQRQPGDNFGYPCHHCLPWLLIVLLAQLSRLREEVAMLLGEQAMHKLPAQVERADPVGALRFWFKTTAGFVGHVAEEQIRVNRLPLPAVHFSDVHGHIRQHARHGVQALEYGDPQWDFLATLLFPHA
eukprot:6172162-Pleurochrysis_carterae.AAC.1